VSQQNVETVRRAIAAINARDLDAYLACCTENVELLTPAAPLGGEYVGADGIRRFLTDIEDVGPDFRIEMQSVQAAGDNNVIAFIRTSATGKISSIRIFRDRDEGLKAVGLI
jgi:ketosteroid isomerase-like protein